MKERIVEHLAVSKLKQRPAGPDPLLRRAARRRQDVARPVDRAHARAEVRAHLGRRRARRGGDPRPPAHVHRRDARLDHPRAARRRVDEPGAPDRRDRQDGRRLPRRSRGGDARGARPGAERARSATTTSTCRSTSRRSSSSAPRTRSTRSRAPLLDRMDVIQLSGYTEDEKLGDRAALPRAEADRGARPRRRAGSTITDRRCGSSIREYTREAGVRGLERRIARPLPQGRDARSPRATRSRSASTSERVRELARAAALLGRGAQAHGRPRRRDRARVHGGRRRRALHRGARRTPGKGRLDDHRAARRRDAGVGAGGALVGALARGRARARRRLVRRARRPHPRAGRRGAEGRAVGRGDDGDGARLARARHARSPTTSA